MDTSFNDDVTGILHLGVSFMDNKEQNTVLFCSVGGGGGERRLELLWRIH